MTTSEDSDVYYPTTPIEAEALNGVSYPTTDANVPTGKRDGTDLASAHRKIQEPLKRAFLRGLTAVIERLKTRLANLEHGQDARGTSFETPGQGSKPRSVEDVRKELARAQDVMARYSNGRYSLEPDPAVLLGARDADGRSGGVLALLYRGADGLVASHPAGIALTGNEVDDAELRGLIVENIIALIAQHNENLAKVSEHILGGCEVCKWRADVRDILKVSLQRKKKLEAAKAEKAELAERAETAEARIKELEATCGHNDEVVKGLQKDIESLRRDATDKEARIRWLDSDRMRLANEYDALRRELSPFKTAFDQIAEVDAFCKKACERRELDKIVNQVRAYVEFYREEHNRVARRKKAAGELGEEQRKLVEADRTCLRDTGHPKVVNRIDLVKAIQPIKAEFMDDLLAYRKDWDKKLGGQTVSQKVYDKLYEGLKRWEPNSAINSLGGLSQVSGIDRKTLKKYHRLGIVDLSRWIPT